MSDFGNYQPETFGWTKTGVFAPYAYKGVPIGAGLNPAPGFRTVVTALLDALVPHIPGGLVPGWCWGGDWTDPTADSFHEYGIAFDLNAPVNPKTPNGSPFGNLHVLPANTGDIVRPFGFEWGGNFSADNPPDYMHIECHLSPAEVLELANSLHPAPTPPGPVTPPHSGPDPFPLPAGYYFGPLSGPTESISGLSTTEGAARNAHRSAIARIQMRVNEYHPPTQLIVDGGYGPQTIGAIRWFQSTHGLTVDGLTGPTTWNRLGL